MTRETTDKTDNDEGFTSLKEGSTNSAAIKAYYDDWAETYDETLQTWDYQAPDEAAATMSTHLNNGDAVLDVGCGTGLFAEALTRRLDCRVEGLDISAASLDIAAKRGVYDRLQQHDLQVTPLPTADDTFDAAVSVGVLTYIEEPADLLIDLCRVVRPGGFIYFTQRDDLWTAKGFDALIETFHARGLWSPLMVSDARPYLPNNDDFRDDIKVVHVLCRVA